MKGRDPQDRSFLRNDPSPLHSILKTRIHISVSPSSPFRIGLHGLDSFGLYHLQQLSLRQDFELAAISAPGDLEIPWPADREPGRCCSGLRELLCEDLDAVILSDLPDQLDRRAEVVNSVLQAGMHVILARPTSLARNGWPEIRESLARTQTQLFMYHPPEFDVEYRTAYRAVSSGSLGDLVSLRWSRFCQALPIPASSSPARLIPEPRWQQGLWESEALSGLAMLLSLHAKPVTRVYADADPQQHHLQILLEFQGGGRGHWEINLASPASLATGWFLTGTQAGFLRDRAFRVTSEGEIVENSVDLQSPCQAAFYDALAESLSSRSSVPDKTAHLSRLFAVFSAAQASAASRNWTEVSSWE